MSTINVALRPSAWSPVHGAQHKPVLIPCPIPHTFTAEVRLGDCQCLNKDRAADGLHADSCPARPIRVTCTISGKTWEESEVASIETHDGALPSLGTCRDLWEIVKALVTNGAMSPRYALSPAMVELVDQRDSVFSALAKAHRAEDALIESLGDYEEAMLGEPVGIYGLKRESGRALERYVAHLIEQVGRLT